MERLIATFASHLPSNLAGSNVTRQASPFGRFVEELLKCENQHEEGKLIISTITRTIEALSREDYEIKDPKCAILRGYIQTLVLIQIIQPEALQKALTDFDLLSRVSLLATSKLSGNILTFFLAIKTLPFNTDDGKEGLSLLLANTVQKMLISGRILVIVEGLKGSCFLMNSWIISLIMEPLLKLLRHGDSLARCHVWRTILVIDKQDPTILNLYDHLILQSILSEEHLDVVASAIQYFKEEKSQEFKKYLIQLLEYLSMGDNLSHHPILVRRLLKYKLIQENIIRMMDLIVGNTKASQSWAAVWMEFLKHGLWAKLCVEVQKVILKKFIEQDNENILFCGLQLLHKSIEKLGEDILEFQAKLSSLINNDDLQIRLSCSRVFIGISNKENWNSILNLLLSRIMTDKVKTPEEHLVDNSIIKSLISTCQIISDELDDDMNLILDKISEYTTYEEIKDILDILKWSGERSSNSRFDCLYRIKHGGNTDDLRSEIILQEASPTIKSNSISMLFESSLFDYVHITDPTHEATNPTSPSYTQEYTENNMNEIFQGIKE